MNQKSLFHIIIATGFGSGFSPFAPGTAGALTATLIWIASALVLNSPTSLLLVTSGLIILFFILGVWSANVMEKTWGKDPSKIVVDEMVGVWITLLSANMDEFYTVVAAFVLFRLFDIFKPLGIRKMEKLKGGLGIMMDDVLAGVYGFLLLFGFRCLIG